MRQFFVIVLSAAVGATTSLGAGEKKADQLRMALVNIKSLYTDFPDAKTNEKNLQANLDRHFYFIDKLAKDADFIGFPELSVNGYRFSKNMTWLNLDGP